MLHILNGGATEAVLAQTAIAGTRFSFRDALIEGPASSVNDAEWRRLRAEHLVGAYDAEINKCEADLKQQEAVFASAAQHGEVTLWFEADLFCQLNLLYVLNWFARNDVAAAKISLICIGEFRGRPKFRGLGELSPTELASLFDQRSLVSESQLQLAAQAWQAFTSSNPQALEKLLGNDTSELPFLRAAMELQLARFPSSRNGLNRIENRMMNEIASGVVRFGDLFRQFIDAEPLYGFGDAQFWNLLRNLSSGEVPLLTGADANQNDPPFASQNGFALTEAGRDVLLGTTDAVKLNGIDTWLGGVHLQGRSNIWRWDDAVQKLVMI